MVTAISWLLSIALAISPVSATPRDALIAQLILVEFTENGQKARSAGPQHHGQCRRFQVDSFEKASADFMLASYPEATLYMPLDHADKNVSGRVTGTCWDMPDPSTGNAFVEVDHYDVDRDISIKQNQANAKEFLKQVQAGDILQMVASFASGGRGTHTLLITRPYDPRDDKLYWIDSNFANTRVDGMLYGYVRAYQEWPIDEVGNWIGKAWNNGATIYRLSDDIVYRSTSEAGMEDIVSAQNE